MKYAIFFLSRPFSSSTTRPPLVSIILSNQVSSSSPNMHLFDITINKHGYEIANTCHKSIVLNVHMDPKEAKTQPTAVFTTCYYHVCSCNKYTHHPGHICHICQIFELYERYIHIQVQHLKSPPCDKVHSINIWYITEQIWLLYCKYCLHG